MHGTRQARLPDCRHRMAGTTTSGFTSMRDRQSSRAKSSCRRCRPRRRRSSPANWTPACRCWRVRRGTRWHRCHVVRPYPGHGGVPSLGGAGAGTSPGTGGLSAGSMSCRVGEAGAAGGGGPGQQSGLKVDGPPRVDECFSDEGDYSGRRSSGFSTSSMLTSLKVITRTCLTNRAGRYMSHTQASASRSSK